MSQHDITVQAGSSIRLLTAGKYCDRDIVVTAEGSGEAIDLDAELAEQEALIPEIEAALQEKIDNETPTQEKTVDITENGTVEILPDSGYALSKVTANVNVKSDGGADLPAGYSRADYILFTGEQIVDTGMICNQNTEIHVVFTRGRSTQHYLYGVASSDNTASVTAYLGGSWRFGNKTATKTVATNQDMIYSGVVNNSQITATGNATTISSVNEFETIGSLLLGSCRGSSGTIGSPQFEGKILAWIMRSGGTLAQKLVPVVSSDGVYRFYDEVSKTFFDSITDVPLQGGNL